MKKISLNQLLYVRMCYVYANIKTTFFSSKTTAQKYINKFKQDYDCCSTFVVNCLCLSILYILYIYQQCSSAIIIIFGLTNTQTTTNYAN